MIELKQLRTKRKQIEIKKFLEREDIEDFKYKSGNYRLTLIAKTLGWYTTTLVRHLNRYLENSKDSLYLFVESNLYDEDSLKKMFKIKQMQEKKKLNLEDIEL